MHLTHSLTRSSYSTRTTDKKSNPKQIIFLNLHLIHLYVVSWVQGLDKAYEGLYHKEVICLYNWIYIQILHNILEVVNL